ncbi:MAG: polysaccharide biosynthesis protein [Verrucomicrobiales bacterium]|nr:polysaccharide biosynthesis protein [Verrucomicrobiales bacterium]
MESTAFRRCLAFVFHLAGIAGCYLLAHLIRFDFDVPEKHWDSYYRTFWVVVASYLSCILLFGLYRGLWRFFTLRDCVITGIAFAVGTVFATGLIFVRNGLTFEDFPRSVLIVTYMLLLFWEIGGRGLVRVMRESRRQRRRQANGRDGEDGRLLLLGDPEEADALLRGVQRYAADLGQVVGIISENPQHGGAKLRGVPIYSGLDRTGDLVKKLRATTLLFLPPFTGPAKIREVVDDLSEKQIACDYRVIPSIDEIASGRVDVSGIRRVAIEDLLYRVPYEIASDMLVHAIGGKRVLVSGAGGSIGSEICRQLLRYRPAVIVLFEVSEFHLFEIEREIRPAAKEAGVEVIACAGDVRRSEQLRAAIRRAGGIDLFYHAAAYKHVDLMERNALACFQNNVVGTQAAIGVAEEEGVKDFVLISTDKAVRPTSLMGASKRLAERLVIERPGRGTKCKAVRFGNVLGSNGSVIPIFRQQIERGGPVTVTSKEVTRYFMTIPEAVELVLAAGAIPEDRRIFVLEMGEAVKIDEMARRMIELSGLIPDVDIPVVYTGLKPGEKEYEELLTDDEDVVRTDLDRIWVVKKNEGEELEPVDVGRILELIDEGDEKALREYADSLIRGSLLLKPEAARR